MHFTPVSRCSLNKYVTTFNANIQNVVGITFQPEQDQCLHVLRPDYSAVSGLSAEAYQWAAVSNLSRIEPTTKSVPPPDIFGNEPEHTWCYYYEKADLARSIPGLASSCQLMAGSKSTGSLGQEWQLSFCRSSARMRC